MKVYALAIVCMLCLMLLQGCASIFGTGPYLKLHVDDQVVITDLVTNQQLKVDTLADDTRRIKLPNGKRYALRVEKDTLASYVFLEPHRDGLTVLNVFNYGFGSIVDHGTRSFYSYDREYIPRPITRNSVPAADRSRVEDSLRARATPVVPTSIIFDRPYAIVVPYGSFGLDGPPDEGGIIGGFASSAGVGVQVVPWVMPVFERGYTSGLKMGDLHNMTATWDAIGVHVQEPELGLFVSCKFGWMTATGNAVYYDWLQRPKPDFKVYARFYMLSAGICGQWGRIEYRYRRNTSWDSHYLIPDLSGNYNGLHYTLHIML